VTNIVPPNIASEDHLAPTPKPRVVRSRPSTAGKIRAELNLEKWPGLWQPAKSKNEKMLRVLEREITNADGSKVVSRVEIGYTHLGTLTTEERKMYGALIEVWEESGKPGDRPVFFSDRLLARILNKSWGTNVRDAIVKSLRKLRTVPVEWINSYYQKDDEGKTVLRERTPFTILSELKIVEREVDGAVNRAVGYFKPDDRILHNLLANYTKPLLLDVMINLRSDIAVLLYTHVDLMLARKDMYERRSRELFTDLGLTNAEYNRQYERFRALKKAMAELEGVRLSTGVLKTARIEKTVDGKDYKTVFKKVAAPQIEAAVAAEQQPAPVVINHYAKPKDPLGEQAAEVVRHFHQVVHGLSAHEPQSKELSQAGTLIGQYGVARARHIIEYAAEQAKQTNFAMQHFGAVLSYASRGAADFQARRQAAGAIPVPAQPAARAEDSVVTPPSRRALRLSALTAEQYRVRFTEARAALLREVPFLAERSRLGSKLEEEMVRVRLSRQLDSEPMDLLPMEALRLPQDLAQILAFVATQNSETTR